jgi:hypothetical protein
MLSAALSIKALRFASMNAYQTCGATEGYLRVFTTTRSSMFLMSILPWSF